MSIRGIGLGLSNPTSDVTSRVLADSLCYFVLSVLFFFGGGGGAFLITDTL